MSTSSFNTKVILKFYVPYCTVTKILCLSFFTPSNHIIWLFPYKNGTTRYFEREIDNTHSIYNAPALKFMFMNCLLIKKVHSVKCKFVANIYLTIVKAKITITHIGYNITYNILILHSFYFTWAVCSWFLECIICVFLFCA